MRKVERFGRYARVSATGRGTGVKTSRSSMAVVLAVTMAVSCRSGAGSRTDSAALPRADSGAQPAASGTPRADSVTLRMDRTTYSAGASMTLTLENAGARQYAFNPCQRTIEHEENGSWTPVPEPGRMCTMEAWILEPHAMRSGPTELPPALAAGTYRIVIRITVEGSTAPASAVTVVSDPITVG